MGVGFRVWDTQSRVQDLRLRFPFRLILSFGFWVLDLGFRVAFTQLAKTSCSIRAGFGALGS